MKRWKTSCRSEAYHHAQIKLSHQGDLRGVCLPRRPGIVDRYFTLRLGLLQRLTC